MKKSEKSEDINNLITVSGASITLSSLTNEILDFTSYKNKELMEKTRMIIISKKILNK